MCPQTAGANFSYRSKCYTTGEQKHKSQLHKQQSNSTNMNKMAARTHLRVYITRPLLQRRRSRLGVVIQWASDLRELRKNVSGIHIFPTMLLFSMRSFMVLLNLSRLSYHV